MHRPLFSLFTFILSPFLLCAALNATVIDVRTLGAKGDGSTLDTTALQRAIDTASKSGGGTVYFSTGRYLTGSLTLKSNVTLHLDAGAVLLGSPDMKNYASDTKSLLYAANAENITIEGRGVIDGNGRAFYDDKLQPLRPRPSPFIAFRNIRNLSIENITICHSPGWTVHTKNCDNVRIRGISLLNDITLVNTDGLDIDSTRNVIISDCRIEAGDDCIVLKTSNRSVGNGKSPSPSAPQLPCENITVTNCILVSAASALKLGTESYGDFRHIRFNNCIIRESRTGLALMCKDGATMEDVHFSNISMTTKPKWGQGVEWPINVDLEKRTDDSRLGAIRNVTFDNIALYTKGRILVAGLPESPIENISFTNITCRVAGYENIKSAKKNKGGNSRGAQGTPEYGSTPALFILANIRGITIDGLDLTWPAVGTSEQPPARHIIAGENVTAPVFRNLPATANTSDLAPIFIK